MIKMILLGDYPLRIKLAFWGSMGALMVVVGTLVWTWVSRHVIVNFSVSLH